MTRLLLLDVRRALLERKTGLCVAMLLYAVVAMPLVVEAPPPHVEEALLSWFGDADRFAVFLFVWIDLAMNKVLAFIPVVLASGVLLSDRDTKQLPIWAAKPLSPAGLFVLRTQSAALVMLMLHLGTTLLGAVWFPMRIEGFRVTPYLLAMALHAVGTVWATVFAATVAMLVQKRVPSALTSILILGILVGFALMGFYQPAWRELSLLNPVTLASLSLGHLDDMGLGAIALPGVALALLSVATLALGARLAARLDVS